VKKKSPPYAFIGAAVLFVICLFALVEYTKEKEKEKEDAIAAANAAAAQALADAKAKQVTVQETPTNLRPVLYATQPVEAGTRISPAFYEKKLTPQDILPDAFTDSSDIVGWYAVRKIETGDPLTPRNIGKSLPYMSQRITPGMRALALPVFNGGDVNDTGGFVVDGDRVDLLFTTADADGLSTRMVMQNLSVLFVPGPQIKTDKTDGIMPVASAGGTISVTFEVTPEQAQALIFMTHDKDGYFSMILRARKDHSEIKIRPFAGNDYNGDFSKVQRLSDKSVERVKELAAEIEAQEKASSAAPTTNEITTPTPPSP
jgi:Flp pilus assembly protein CpaB